jgi:hypothetical protein
MRSYTLKALVLAVGISVAIGAASANAGSLRQGSTGSGGAVTGSLPGQVLWTYYQTINGGVDTAFLQVCPPGNGDGGVEDALCNNAGFGDNILRLINPNGAANGNLAGAKPQTVCAMIYVFDDDEEMGECCGCPLSSAGLATFSVNYNLTSNWSLPLSEVGAALTNDNALGAIGIVATAPNTIACLGGGGGAACNAGCDPTNVPGYAVTTTSNLLGSITHDQVVIQPLTSDTFSFITGLTEIQLSDDGGGDLTNLTYLQTQCGALVGNGTGGGICNCPIE